MNSNQTKYVDGFVLVVPKDKVEEYRKMAQEGAEAWMRHGALNYKECMLEHPNPEHVTLPFPKLAQASDNETVWFSYIEFKDRAHRDEVNAKVMKEMEEKYDENQEMPFDMNKMSYGGFEVMVG